MNQTIDSESRLAEAAELTCLVYVSSATQLFARDELRTLVEAAARNNLARDLTGLLCHYDGSFLQVLEGSAPAVDATLAAIRKDPRHQGMVVMYRRPIPQRVFADWSMALMGPDQLGEDQLVRLRDLRGLDLSGLPDPGHQPDLAALIDTFRAWIR